MAHGEGGEAVADDSDRLTVRAAKEVVRMDSIEKHTVWLYILRQLNIAPLVGPVRSTSARKKKERVRGRE